MQRGIHPRRGLFLLSAAFKGVCNLVVRLPLPVHASWLNQIEIYFSIVSRKVLTPDDFADLEAVKQKLLASSGVR